jgi:tetratricopeptide (TPR) repeat protein
MEVGVESVAIDPDWARIRDLAAKGFEEDAFSLLREKLGSDGNRVMSAQELRFNVLVALSGFATGETIEVRLSAMCFLVEQLHDSYKWLKKMDVISPVTDVQALIVAGEWVQIASIFRLNFGRPDWGVAAADIALKKKPDNVAALTTKMASKADLGLYSSAEQIFTKARKISPDSVHLHAAWARIQRERGRYPDALESAMKVAAKLPSPETMRLVGTVFEAWGEMAAAVSYYKAAERIPPKVSSRETYALIEGYKKLLVDALARKKFSPEELEELIDKQS